MRGNVCLAAAVFALATLASSASAVQPAPAPQLFGVHKEVVRPSRIEAYEATNRELIGLLQQAPGTLGKLGFTTFMAEDFTYYMVAPLSAYGDAAAIYTGFEETAQAVGPAKFLDVMRRSGDTIETMSDSIFAEDPALSYRPARPRLQPADVRFVHFDVYCLQPGRDFEADEVARAFRALFEKKGIADGYRIFKVVTGSEMPALVVAVDARDLVDYATSDAANRKKLGAEGEALFARAFSLTRRFERFNTLVRPDLSLAPVAAR